MGFATDYGGGEPSPQGTDAFETPSFSSFGRQIGLPVSADLTVLSMTSPLGPGLDWHDIEQSLKDLTLDEAQSDGAVFPISIGGGGMSVAGPRALASPVLRRAELGDATDGQQNPFIHAKADPKRLNLSKLSLKKAQLQEAFLARSVAIKTDFTEANLRKADVRKAVWIKVNMTKADATEANFREANLMQINAQLAKFDGATMVKTVAKEANFNDASLIKADATKANSKKPSLTKPI